MINRVVLTGRLTRDPEVQVSQSNIPVAKFSLAVNRAFSNANGEREADFINCVAFRKQAENIQQYVKKGQLVGVDGRIQTRNYTNKEGQKVYVTEVVCDSVQFLETRNQQSNQQSNRQSDQRYEQRYEQGQIAQVRNSANLQSDDTLPF